MYSHTHLLDQIIWQPLKQVLSVKCPTSKPQCIVDYSNVNVWWNITTLLIKGANFNNKFLTLTMGLRESIQIMPNRWHRLGDFFQMLLNCSLSSKIETYRHMKLRDNPPPSPFWLSNSTMYPNNNTGTMDLGVCGLHADIPLFPRV